MPSKQWAAATPRCPKTEVIAVDNLFLLHSFRRGCLFYTIFFFRFLLIIPIIIGSKGTVGGPQFMLGPLPTTFCSQRMASSASR